MSEISEEVQILKLLDEDFKLPLKMLKELKETMSKEIMEIKRMMYENVRNITKR